MNEEKTTRNAKPAYVNLLVGLVAILIVLNAVTLIALNRGNTTTPQPNQATPTPGAIDAFVEGTSPAGAPDIILPPSENDSNPEQDALPEPAEFQIPEAEEGCEIKKEISCPIEGVDTGICPRGCIFLGPEGELNGPCDPIVCNNFETQKACKDPCEWIKLS